MKRVIQILFIVFNVACSKAQQTNESNLTDTLSKEKNETKIESLAKPKNLNYKPGNNYNSEKLEINKTRTELNIKYNQATDIASKNEIIDSVSIFFTKALLNEIIPYWYGTVWDFNGHTSIPNQGTIACGYFVSTTLKDMGLNLNRYKLAQQTPENEAKSIAIESNETLYIEQNGMNNALINLDEGLYFMGLDNHVGFLYKYNKNAYFIHSNYDEGKVMIENTEFSRVFYSAKYYLSKITGNKKLMEKWLKMEEVQIIIEKPFEW